MKRQRREVHTREQVLVLLALVLAEPVPSAIHLHDPARVRAQATHLARDLEEARSQLSEEREKAAKRPRKAGKTVKSSAYVEDSDDVPLQSQTGGKADVGKTGPAEQPTAGPSGDKGKGVDRGF